MEVTTNLTKFDLLKLNLHVMPRSKANWIVWALLSIGISFSSYVRSEDLFTTRDIIILMLSGAIVASFCMLFGVAVSIICNLLLSRKDNGVIGQHKYKITDEGLFEETIANETLTKWGSIKNITQNNNFIFVQVAPCLFHLLPKKSFESSQDFNDFYEALQKCTKSV